ncbi:MAG: class I SAM-dependent methyltransferase [Candidatus Bathyarchaeota archaeon]|nr:class I SAM-dependent methyltransferase [Candidatus Bathyarchaeum sp.]
MEVRKSLALDENLKEKIRKANIVLHKYEANYYELIHPEIYNEPEQKRLISALKNADNLISTPSDGVKMALDFGAGTGNVTGKLLSMGYHVTAVDLSGEMCSILEKKYSGYIKSKQLVVMNFAVEDLVFGEDTFDLITCYSVLHHLPDYVGAVRSLSHFLKKGGVMYIDHEISPFYWEPEPKTVTNLFKFVYLHLSPTFNSLYFRLVGLNLPPLDYHLSDYWYAKKHQLNHNKIEQVFQDEAYEYHKRHDYHLRRGYFLNPLFHLCARFCRPETSLWLAKK